MSSEETQEIENLCIKLDKFRQKLIMLINKYSLENDSNTPDYLIADFMIVAYLNMTKMIVKRDEWYGVHLEPGNKYFKKEGVKDEEMDNK